jgi:hypothetical protein
MFFRNISSCKCNNLLRTCPFAARIYGITVLNDLKRFARRTSWTTSTYDCLVGQVQTMGLTGVFSWVLSYRLHMTHPPWTLNSIRPLETWHHLPTGVEPNYLWLVITDPRDVTHNMEAIPSDRCYWLTNGNGTRHIWAAGTSESQTTATDTSTDRPFCITLWAHDAVAT